MGATAIRSMGSAPARRNALGKVRGRAYALVTYDDGGGSSPRPPRRIVDGGEPPALTSANIGPNPDFSGLAVLPPIRQRRPATEAIVALGGGSVMDAAKVLAARRAISTRCARPQTGEAPIDELGRHADHRRAHHLRHRQRGHDWATVWDTEPRQKYSLARDTSIPRRRWSIPC